MTIAVTWDKPDQRFYENGLDRGLLYLPGMDPVPWNGLTGCEESSASSDTSVLYRDGEIYLADVDPNDFAGSITALFFPDEFHACLGIPEAAPGFYVDNQKPKRFGLSYRSLVGSGTTGDMFGYQIHLIYNAVASINVRTRKTLGDNVDPVEFSFDIVATPVRLPGYRPTAHYIIDTRNLPQLVVDNIEMVLYGDGWNAALDIITEPITEPMPGVIPGRLPLPEEIIAIMASATDFIDEPIPELIP